MAVTTVLLVIFAVAMGIATFIESSEGASAARQAVYNAVWFEALLVFLCINLIGSLIRYKSFHRRKWSMILFHLSFIIIIIGAGITRYYSYDGMMHIREGQSSNFFTISGADLSISKNNVQIAQISLSDLSDEQSINAENISISMEEYIPAAAKMVNPDMDGKPTIWLVTADMSFNYQSFHLQYGDFVPHKEYNFNFESGRAGDINFVLINDTLFARCKLGVVTTQMKDMTHQKIAADSLFQVSDTLLYQVGMVSFMLKKYLPKGRIDVVSMVGHQGNFPYDALKIRIQKENFVKNDYVFGSTEFEGPNKNIEIDGDTFSFSYGPSKVYLPFSLFLEDFIIERYINSRSPSSYRSNVILIDSTNKTELPYSIYMNHILKYQGYRFFQSSYDNDERGTILSVNYDPVGTKVTYLGYFLMTLGMLLALFSNKSHFRELLKRKSSKIAMTALFLGFSINTFSQQINHISEINIDANHAEKFSKLLVADPKGRVKPVHTLAAEALRKVSRKSHIEGKNPTQVLLSIMAEQGLWESFPFIKVTNEEIRSRFGFQEEFISLQDVMKYEGGRTSYLLKNDVDIAYAKPANQQTRFDKELLKLDERINIVDMIFSGALLHIFPVPADSGNKWLSLEELSFPMDDPELQKELTGLFTDWYKGFKIGITTNNWAVADAKLDKILDYQKTHISKDIPTETKIELEIFYNKVNYFKYSSKIYLVAGLILLVLLFVKLIRQKEGKELISKFFIAIIAINFVAHTATLGLRWYISGHAPWSNGYETTLFIAWATVLAGLVFANRSQITLALTSVLAAVFILISSLSWMDPEITNLVPVLKSYWLIIHVAVITSSYGFFAIAFLLGLTNIIIYSSKSFNNNIAIKNTIEELSSITVMAMIIGVYLMTIGTFLGAVWANESWGRYWGWDPKETWALITVIVYSIAIHLRQIPGFNNAYIVSTAGLLSFGSVLMTYFGVNYFLTGMHSYAGGDAFSIPLIFKLLVEVLILLITKAGYNFISSKKSA